MKILAYLPCEYVSTNDDFSATLVRAGIRQFIPKKWPGTLPLVVCLMVEMEEGKDPAGKRTVFFQDIIDGKEVLQEPIEIELSVEEPSATVLHYVTTEFHKASTLTVRATIDGAPRLSCTIEAILSPE